MHHPFIQQEVDRLLHSISPNAGCDAVCTLSPSVYDTAWVSMVQKPGYGVLFPDCFDYLLQTQLPDGSWGSEHADIDGILSTLAALLAMRRWRPHLEHKTTEIHARCIRAENWLNHVFATWRVEETERVGFEILVPNLIRLLEAENVHFELSGKPLLMAFYEAKMDQFRKILEGPKQTTLLHSLEALCGILDFDKVKHHKLPDGSMLGSPSSTAAYLMNGSTWDHEAEAYLRKVVESGSTSGVRGGCPSAYPTTIFESTWVLSVLLESGLPIGYLGSERLGRILTMLEHNLEAQGGVVGFAPSCLADVDDTAKALTLLSMAGRPANVDPLIKSFQGDECFLTYKGERNPSLSANCNALTCLLRSTRPSNYSEQILMCVRFITKSASAESPRDKWNTSSLYSIMLVSQSFTLFLEKWQDDASLSREIPEDLLRQSLPESLLLILRKILNSQHHHGSWNSNKEETAYAVIALVALLRLPWIERLRPEILASIRRGKNYIDSVHDHWAEGQHLWIEKVAYASENLSRAYCVAASWIEPPNVSLGKRVDDLCIQSRNDLERLRQFFAHVLPFSKMSGWEMELSLILGLRWVPSLLRERLRIFPPLKVADEKYMTYIPFTWIGSRSVLLSSISNDTLWDMIRVSLFNFQMDAYMETVLRESYHNKYDELKDMINNAFHFDQIHGSRPWSGTTSTQTDQPRSDPARVVQKFVDYILQHPRILESPSHLQRWLAHELRSFLLAHVTQLEDCAALQKDTTSADPLFKLSAPRTTYYNWVRTTGATHTSCAYSFVFFLCLICPRDNPALVPNGKQRYILESMCHSLATLCRQYNDFGSVARDRKEKNLNSIDFPEFQDFAETRQAPGVEESMRQELLSVAAYERKHLDLGVAELKTVVDETLMRNIELFITVTNLYGDIYLAKDIGMKVATVG